jgi:hypothetical protein
VVETQPRFGSALASSAPVSSIAVVSLTGLPGAGVGVGVAVGPGVGLPPGVALGVALGPALGLPAALGVLDVPGVPGTPVVGAAVGVPAGAPLPDGFVSLPQATNSRPIVAIPAAARWACFHPRAVISGQPSRDLTSCWSGR